MPRIGPFETYPDEYDKWFEDNRELYQAEIGLLKGLIDGDALLGLEVGTGSGKFSVPLDIKIGVEPSWVMAQRAKGFGIKVVKAVAEGLPFKGKSLDFVLLVTTICFLDDVLKGFMEAKRVLKDGGFVLVGFVDRESELGKTYLKRRDESKFYKEATFYSARNVLYLLKMSGFRDIISRQCLMPGMPPEATSEGFGKGSFVAMKGLK